MTTSSDARSLLESIVGYGREGHTAPDPADRAPKIATVDPAFAGVGPARVVFDGEGVLTTRAYPWLTVAPSAGSRVVLVPVGRSYVIAGPISGGYESTGDLSLYASLDGDDRNDGSIERPVKTLRQLCRLVPTLILPGHTVTAHIAGDGDYNETLKPEYKLVLGHLVIAGQGAEPTDVQLNQMLATGIQGSFELTNVAVKERFSQPQFWLKHCTDAFVTDCVAMGEPDSDINASGRVGFLADEATRLRLRGPKTRATYKRYFARVQDRSTLYVDNVDQGLDANGNPTSLFGVGARQGGVAHLADETARPRGIESDETVDNGSALFGPRGFRSTLDRDEEAIVDQWVTRNSPPRKKSYAFAPTNLGSTLPNFTPTRRLRLTFDGTKSAGDLIVDVTFEARLSPSNLVYQHKRFVATLDGGAFYVVHSEIRGERFPSDYAPAKSSVITANNLLVNGQPGSRFVIDVDPQVTTVADVWGVHVEVAHMGVNAAPKIIGWRAA